ncbi:MAG: DNA mismatch endonuclease Vsr [Gammaproteobacteria bacterium]|nr:DNA mismatch endonuclease Vsr [Gammaproteobacteria bacterium]
MTDIVDKATRSRMMAGISGKDTKPELTLRRALHRRGFRFRLHVRNLPSKPDLVLRRHGAVCFVHGCFWHRHPGCRYATTPATRPDFWQAKFKSNVERDHRSKSQLLKAGWRVAIVWECALRGERVEMTIRTLEQWLLASIREFETAPLKPRSNRADKTGEL